MQEAPKCNHNSKTIIALKTMERTNELFPKYKKSQSNKPLIKLSKRTWDLPLEVTLDLVLARRKILNWKRHVLHLNLKSKLLRKRKIQILWSPILNLICSWVSMTSQKLNHQPFWPPNQSKTMASGDQTKDQFHLKMKSKS